MMTKLQRTTKHILSICLVVLMILLSVSVVFAEEFTTTAVQLSEDNIVEYPTATGEMYYTQKVGDYITISGGVVTTDGTETGTVVPGHFEFIDPSFMPTPNDAERASIKFIPDDKNAYVGFEIARSRNVTFLVKRPMLELVDSATVPVASDIASSGDRLRTSTITGVDVKCSLTGQVLTAAKWSWTKGTTKVTESGYYPARATCTNYESVTVYIYVKIAGDTSTPVISEFPTIQNIAYKDGITAADLTIVGGSTTIPGTFAVADPTQELKGGSNVVGVVFTPDDTSVSAVNISMVINVDKMESSFIDDEGNAIVPEIRVPIGYELNYSSLSNLVGKLTANCGKFTIQSFSNISYDTSITGEYDAKARISPADNNYSNEINFKLIIEPKEVSPYFTAYGNDEYIITTGNYQTKPQGTFDLYANDELVMEDIAYLTRFTWRPVKSGIYTLKAVYNPVDNDTFKVNDAVRTDLVLNLTWVITAVNSTAKPCAYGDTAVVRHRLGNTFAGWVFYDENGNEFTPENVVEDTSTSSVSFTMPDFAITVKALSTDDAGDGDASSSGMLGWLQRLIKWISDIVSHILNFWNGL